jgi:N-acetylneuraminic acid mutarotase
LGKANTPERGFLPEYSYCAKIFMVSPDTPIKKIELGRIIKMKKRIAKIGVLALLFVALLIPGTGALAADEEAGWSPVASMSMSRKSFQTEVIDGEIYAIGGYEYKSETYFSSVEVYDPSTNAWTTLAPMSTARSFFQAEIIDGKIYAIGGTFGSTYLSSTEVYDPSTNTWTTLAPMSTARDVFQTEVIDGKIYAIGGYTGSTFLSSTEVYDPSTNTWTMLAPMSTAKANFQTQVIDGKIYAIGGNSGTYLSSVEVYDPATNAWTTLAPMSTARSVFQTEVINEKIYAIGGSAAGTYSSSIEVYDPSTNTWTTLAPMSTARYALPTQVIDGKIYAMGGSNGSTPLSSTEVYDPSTNTWTTLAPMSIPRSFFQAEVVDGIIYAIGGINTDSVEAYTVTPASTAKQLKVVLGVGENLQLSISDDLSENGEVTWTSSDSAVASVDASGVVTAAAPGNAVITVSDGGSYTESIHILVVEDADEYRLAVDLTSGKTCRLTADDNTNTEAVTWASVDPSVATVSEKGHVTAVGTGLTVIAASDADGNQIGQVYVRVRA